MSPAVHVDFESYSAINLKLSGMFRYAEDRSTQILIMAYCIGEGEVIGVDLSAGPESHRTRALHDLFDAINDGLEVAAHNAQFERLMWELKGNFPITPKPDQWNCTAARARLLAIPGSLDGAAAALGVPVRKDERGTALINLFSKPQPKTGIRVLPADRPEEFEEFIDYCRTDVKVERELDKILPQLSRKERRAFRLDYDINRRGLPVNMSLVRKAKSFVEEYSEMLLKRSIEISGYRPTQREKTLDWLESRGHKLPNLQAPTVEALAAKPGLAPDIRELLDYRIEVSRAGTKKLTAIENTVSDDGRIRGGFLFSAASTRRWSSTGVQLHNLQKPEGLLDPMLVVRVLLQDPWALELFYDRPLSSIAQSIRGFFQAQGNKVFHIADYASVEPRGLAWLAGEEWILEAYRKKQDLYRITAGKVYHIPRWEDIPKDGKERFMGKQLVLGCGYGMGPPRFIETCRKFGQELTDEESAEAVYGYRDTVPNITKFWRGLNAMCIKAVRTGRPQRLGKLQFRPCTLANGFEVLFVDMPSGSICYPNPSIGQEEWNGRWNDTFEFYTNLGTKFIKTDTFGGSIAENVTQALTRDILRDGLVAADDAGHNVVGHVHDEGIAEGDNNPEELKDFEYRLSRSSPWAKGFPIETEGFSSKVYKK